MGVTRQATANRREPSLRVLVVDDSATARRAIAHALAELGTHVAYARSAEEALRLLGSARAPEFDVVTVDLNLPEMNGVDLVAEIRRQFTARSPRIVVISSYCDDRAAARALRAAGVTRLLPKPFFGAQVRESVAGTGCRSAPWTRTPEVPHAADGLLRSGARVLHGDIDELRRRFAALANERGVEFADRELLGGLPQLAPATVALRRLLLADLLQDDAGRYHYPKDR